MTGENAYHQQALLGHLGRASLDGEAYQAVRGHLGGYVKACNEQEKRALYRVATSSILSADKDSTTQRLFDRGLIRIQGGVFRPFNQLFRMARQDCLLPM